MPRPCCTRSTICSAGSNPLPDRTARVPRPAELPESHQGSRSSRLLDWLGGHRRHGHDLERARQAIRRRPRRTPATGRHIAILGDAELDEGAIWEALVDPQVPRFGEVLWIVDLNRQSLDRVVPDIAAGRIGAMFEAAGWQTITVKYGRRLRELFERPGGDALRQRIDTMSNEEYQRMLRSPVGRRARSVDQRPPTGPSLKRLLSDLDDRRGGRRRPRSRWPRHRRSRRRLHAGRHARPIAHRWCSRTRSRRVRLPTEGHPANHSALLSPDQWRALAGELDADADDPWATFVPGRPNPSCARPPPAAAPRRSADRSSRSRCRRARPAARPVGSTQQALGRFFVDLTHVAPPVAGAGSSPSAPMSRRRPTSARGSTASVCGTPDERLDWFSDDAETMMKWREGTGRTAHRARHRRRQPGRPAGRARARRGHGGAHRCCRSARSTTRSSPARSSSGRSASMPAGSRSSSAPHPASPWRQKEGHTSRSSRHRSASSSRNASAGSRASPRTWNGRMLHALGQLGAPRRHLVLLPAQHPPDRSITQPRCPTTATNANTDGGSASPADTRSAAVQTCRRSRWSAWASSCRKCSTPRRSSTTAGIANDVICLTSANLVFRAVQARQGLADGNAPNPRRAVPRRHAGRRSSPCSTATHTRSPSSPASTAHQSPTSVSATSAKSATSTISTATTASTSTPSSAPPGI